MARKIAYGTLFFVVGLFFIFFALLIIEDKFNINFDENYLFAIVFFGAVLFSIVGIKNSNRQEGFYVKSSFIALGVILGLFLSSEVSINLNKFYPDFIKQNETLYFVIFMAIWIIGIYIGYFVGKKFSNRSLVQGETKSGFFTWFSYKRRRVEGNNIIYEMDKNRYLYFIGLVSAIYFICYIINFNHPWITIYIILIYQAIGNYSKLSDSIAAKSRKMVVREDGIIEYWYQMS